MTIDYTEALQNLNNQQRLDPLPFARGYISSGGSVTETIQNNLLFNSQMNVMSFPADMTDRYFVIMEGELSGIPGTSGGVGGALTNFQNTYRLPFPTTIQDTHDVKYDHNFNWLQTFANALGVGGAVNAFRAGAQGVGYAVNNFKALTLSTPNFRTFSLEFRCFPKSRAESDTLQAMVAALKTAMHPPLTAGSFLLEFPKVFLMWFNTGNEYLFKFKPVVINAMQVNFQGDNPVPTFYRNPQNLAIPEGIVIRMSCVETEIWTRENFENFTSSNPLSATTSTINGANR